MRAIVFALPARKLTTPLSRKIRLDAPFERRVTRALRRRFEHVWAHFVKDERRVALYEIDIILLTALQRSF